MTPLTTNRSTPYDADRADPTPFRTRKELDAESPAFDLLYKGGRDDAIPRKIGADAWFEFKGADRYEVQEQSFPLPHNEILTLLILPDSALAN